MSSGDTGPKSTLLALLAPLAPSGRAPTTRWTSFPPRSTATTRCPPSAAATAASAAGGRTCPPQGTGPHPRTGRPHRGRPPYPRSGGGGTPAADTTRTGRRARRRGPGPRAGARRTGRPAGDLGTRERDLDLGARGHQTAAWRGPRPADRGAGGVRPMDTRRCQASRARITRRASFPRGTSRPPRLGRPSSNCWRRHPPGRTPATRAHGRRSRVRAVA